MMSVKSMLPFILICIMVEVSIAERNGNVTGKYQILHK